MAFWIVGLVALVALGALVLYVLREQSIDRERVETELHDGRHATLEYAVPPGEDPVVVLAALEQAGYTAGVDTHGAQQVVVVSCTEDKEQSRARIRAVIEHAGEAPHHEEVRTRPQVHFRDE